MVIYNLGTRKLGNLGGRGGMTKTLSGVEAARSKLLHSK